MTDIRVGWVCSPIHESRDEGHDLCQACFARSLALALALKVGLLHKFGRVNPEEGGGSLSVSSDRVGSFSSSAYAHEVEVRSEGGNASCGSEREEEWMSVLVGHSWIVESWSNSATLWELELELDEEGEAEAGADRA